MSGTTGVISPAQSFKDEYTKDKNEKTFTRRDGWAKDKIAKEPRRSLSTMPVVSGDPKAPKKQRRDM